MPPLPPSAAPLLAELESSSAAPLVVQWIRRALAEGADFDLYKVNAWRVADEAGATPREALRAFLFATRLGLFDLTWDVRCPSCDGMPAYHRHLMELQNRAHCDFCRTTWDLDFESQVEATFTVNPGVRPMSYADFGPRTPQEKFRFFFDVLGREGRLWTVGESIHPGKDHEFRTTLDPGTYRVWLPSHLDRAVPLSVAGRPVRRAQEVAFRAWPDGGLDPASVTLRPGPVLLRVHSDYPTVNGFLVRRTGGLRNWISASFVTAQQDFRDLFAGEFLTPGTSFAVRSLTLLFTDIKGSTRMYEDLGDARAYALVHDHFQVMMDRIRAHDGGVVKTIGDAVMAAFPVNLGAVRAALEIQERIEAAGARLRGLSVKLGLHRGPCIAVTSNRALDYFGRTANLAARVQNEARAGEVLATAPVLDDPLVRSELAARGGRPPSRRVALKGIGSPVRVFVLRPASEA